MTTRQRQGGSAQDTAGNQIPARFQVNAPTLIMTDRNTPVTAGGATHGYISGTPASLAASATVSVWFDLGPEFDQYQGVVVSIAPSGASSGFSAVSAFGGDKVGISTGRRLNGRYSSTSSTIYASINTSVGQQSFEVRPFGRYFGVQLSNADASNPMDANASVSIAAFAR